MKRQMRAILAGAALLALPLLAIAGDVPRFRQKQDAQFTGDGGAGVDTTVVFTARGNAFWVFHGSASQRTVYTVYLGNGSSHEVNTNSVAPVYVSPMYGSAIDSIQIDCRDTPGTENYWFTLVTY